MKELLDELILRGGENGVQRLAVPSLALPSPDTHGVGGTEELPDERPIKGVLLKSDLNKKLNRLRSWTPCALSVHGIFWKIQTQTPKENKVRSPSGSTFGLLYLDRF